MYFENIFVLNQEAFCWMSILFLAKCTLTNKNSRRYTNYPLLKPPPNFPSEIGS